MFEYQVCLSFAGEDRAYVEKVAESLSLRGVKVFYDRFEEVNLWGKNLFDHLDDIYQNRAEYCVLFASAAYAAKIWTGHERRSAQARALRNKREYILPARFDETEIPGLLDTVAYVNLRGFTPDQFADLIEQKVRSGNHSPTPTISPPKTETPAPASVVSQPLVSIPAQAAALKPRQGDGPLSVTREGRGALILIPLEGGGRLALEVSTEGGILLGGALRAAARASR